MTHGKGMLATIRTSEAVKCAIIGALVEGTGRWKAS